MNKERERYILQKLLKNKKVTVKELAKELYASEPSIRRDLCSLEKQNLLKRVHGGAVLEKQNNSSLKIPFVLRQLEDSDAKTIMAEKAARLVNDGDTVMMDASSSAFALIPFLAQKNNITVITSGVKALTELAEYGINAYSTGGHLLPSCLSLVEGDALDTIEKYNADIVFFSCRGISPDGAVTDLSIEEDLVRQKMIKHSKKSVLLCASEKFNKTYMHNLCAVKDVTFVISEADIPSDLPWSK